MVRLTPKAARALRGVTQKEMAEYLGINRTTLSRKEGGEAQFKADEMDKFLSKLHLADGDVDFVCHDCHKK